MNPSVKFVVAIMSGADILLQSYTRQTICIMFSIGHVKQAKNSKISYRLPFRVKFRSQDETYCAKNLVGIKQ